MTFNTFGVHTMDMFNKLKAKLAEELDSESERDERSSVGTAGPNVVGPDGTLDAHALQKEVLELKEHINKNYFVYVRRLEKRKERIRELEEYAKLLLKDNEALQGKAKERDGEMLF